MRQVLDALVAALEADAAMLRVVFEELPASRNRASRLALERRVRELATAYLAGLFPHVRSLSTASWVLVLTVEQLATRWVLDQPDVPRAQLLDEMEALVTSYLVTRTSVDALGPGHHVRCPGPNSRRRRLTVGQPVMIT